MKKEKKGFNWSQLEGYYITPRAVSRNKILGSPAKKVLCYLMTLWSSNDSIHPSVTTIADITDQSERSVKYALKELLEHRLLNVVQRGNGRGLANSYNIVPSRVNEFFGCEILVDDVEPNEEEKKGTVQPAKTPVTSKDPLAWMNMDYYKKDREEKEYKVIEPL